MYAGDAFFTLGPLGQVGLLALSSALAALWLVVLSRLCARLPGRPWPRVTLAGFAGFGAFALFVWLTPQIYYLYYQTLFTGLPWQIVVQAPPAPARLIALLRFEGPSSLAAHGQGALGWLLLVRAVQVAQRRHPAPAAGPGAPV